MKPIRFFINKSFDEISKGKMTLFPLIDCLLTDGILESNSDFEFVEDQKRCDYFLFPIAIEQLFLKGRQEEILEFISCAKNNNKKVLLFTSGDIGLSLNFDNIITLRLGGFRTNLNSQTFIMPPFIDDPYSKLKIRFSPIEKADFPRIGFVGQANGGIIKIIKDFSSYVRINIYRLFKSKYIDYQPFYPSSFFRYKCLNILKHDNYIKTNFIYRRRYRAGVKTPNDLEKTSLEFYQNMNNSPYTFCMRGAGNFSVRFYETLAMGRIPVLIDTDCKLPFSEQIDWNKHCVIIKTGDFNNIGLSLNHFHKSLSNEGFLDLQYSNRALWQTTLNKYNYFIKLKQILIDELK